MDGVAQFCDNEKYSDIEFIFVDGNALEKTVFAHKVILSLRSELILALGLESENRGISRVHINDCSVDDFLFLLEFIYTQQLPSGNQPIERCLTIMQLASRYRINSLLAQMKSKIECELSQHTVMKALGTAEAMQNQHQPHRSPSRSPRAEASYLESAANVESVKATCMRFLLRLEDPAFEMATAVERSASCSCELIADIFTRRAVRRIATQLPQYRSLTSFVLMLTGSFVLTGLDSCDPRWTRRCGRTSD
jgi:hypothetical protein